MLSQKRLDVCTPRRASGAADAAALDPGDRRAEAQRFRLALAFGQRQRESAVQGVASTERIHRADDEHRHAAQRASLEEQDIIRPVADRKERVGLLRDYLKPFGKIAAARCCAQAIREKDDVRGAAKQHIVYNGRFVGVEHDAQLAAPRRLADRPYELRISVVGEHEVGGSDDAVRIGRRNPGDALVAVGHDGAVAA